MLEAIYYFLYLIIIIRIGWITFCDTFKKDLYEEVNFKEEFSKDTNKLERFSLEHANIYYDFLNSHVWTILPNGI